jgi:arginine deiminase
MMGESRGRIGLQETIAALRKELVESIIASQAKGLRFEVGEITMEFHIEVERSTEIKGGAKGGIKIWVVELGAAELGAGAGSIHCMSRIRASMS